MQVKFGYLLNMRRNPNSHAHTDLRDAVDVTRFWSLVDRKGDDDCWPWTGFVDDDGYGGFRWRGRMVGAHELALSFSTGEARLPRLDTCHSCDNPPCVNPKHLRFGTRSSNMAEMVARGRAVKPNARLTPEQVVTIRERREAGARQMDLAQEYGISRAYVSGIVRGSFWKEVGGPIQTERKYIRVE